MSHKSYGPCAVYIMAGKRFRVPTLQEMEKADNEEALVTSRPLFRRDAASKSVDHSSDAKGPVSTPLQNNPPKRMLSQKALLSQQPLSRLSRRAKSTTMPKETTRSSPDKFKNSGRDSSSGRKGVTSNRTGGVLMSNSGKVDTVQRQAHQPNTSNSGKVDTVQRQAHQPNNAQAVKAVETVASGTAQPQAAARGSSEQATEAQDAVRADVLPTLAKLGKTNSLVVNSKQRGNPILNYVRNVPWEFGNIVPDYVMGQCNCALYLSLRYHQLHPDYIHHRLRLLGRSFDLRVLLVQVDIKDPHHLLKDLAKICILADCTLMVAFSAEEAGRYLETYKVYENKAAEAIMERTDSNFNIQLSDCLTRVKSVNKTDCATLLATFGNLQGIMGASSEDLALCPGFGPQKAKRLHDVFREPFLVSKKQRAADTGK